LAHEVDHRINLHRCTWLSYLHASNLGEIRQVRELINICATLIQTMGHVGFSAAGVSAKRP
jgi:hypothetical protein